MTGQAIAMPATIGRHGEEPAARLAHLFDTHHQRLYRLARRLSRSSEDAHDLVQETFLRAARAPQSVPDGASNEEAWLVRILINLCRDGWRWSAVRSRAVADGRLDPPDVTSPEPALVAKAMVQRALGRLAPRRRAILVLYELEGIPIRDIAAMLGVSAVTVRWHLSIGRREMAKALGAGRTS
jgi:RNA polymerase sigma-70 factor (ECF subfamily)